MPITQKLKILHLEDIPTDAELIDRALSRSGLLFEKLVIDNKEDYIRALTEFKPDIILSDHSLPSFNSVEALKLLQERYLRIPFILITATISEEFAVDIMKAGATDYILKDRTQRLPSAITNALEKFRLLQEHERAIAQQAAILNALSPNITLLNEDGKIIAVNESWKKSAIQNNLGMPNYGVGYSYIAIAEKANAVDQGTAAAMAAGIRSVINGIKPAFILEYVSNIGGKQRWFQLVVEPLADKNEKGAVVIHIDITDRKIAQQSVLQSEANLKTIFENTDLSIILLDPDLRIVSFNSAANQTSEKLFGKKIKAGNKINNYLPSERRSLLRKIVERVNNGETVNYESSYLDTQGAVRWFDIRWVKILNSNKENSGVILSAKDITEKKKHEKQSAIVTADLIQRNKDLEQFAYIVSHDLRAPVANISGLLNLHTFHPHSKDEIETLEALTRSVNNLDKIIIDLNHVLQVSSEVNGKREHISLSGLVEEIKSGISQMINKNQAVIIYDFSEKDDLLILKSYLYSIFQNLIVNSIKYARANVSPVINISSKTDGHTITIDFSDNGKGIDISNYGRELFGLYKRFDKTVEGKGMGLFMVKSQVESLGGHIEVQSELNKGTHFRIEFPLEERN